MPPKVKLLIHYGYHQTAEDARHIESVLRSFKPHVYAFENADGSIKPSMERDLTRHFDRARKDVRERQAFLAKFGEDSFGREQMRVILDQHRTLKSFSLEYGGNTEYTERARQLSEESREAFLSGNLERAIQKNHEVMQWIDKFNREREGKMVETAERLAEKLVETHPNLEGEGEIRVYARLGAYHTAVYQELKKKGYDVERVFDANPMLFPLTHSIPRSKRLPDLTDAKYKTAHAREILADSIKGDLTDGIQNSNREDAVATIIATRFSHDEIQQISKEIGQNTSLFRQRRNELKKRILTKYLEGKGIALPANDEEAEAFIRKKYPKIDFSKPWYASVRRG